MASRVQRLADELQGTCRSLGETCEALGFDQDDLTQDEHMELDGLVFSCAQCDWWCEACEANENVHDPDAGDLCDDCACDEAGK